MPIGAIDGEESHPGDGDGLAVGEREGQRFGLALDGGKGGRRQATPRFDKRIGVDADGSQRPTLSQRELCRPGPPAAGAENGTDHIRCD